MKYKIGDKVKIREDLKGGFRYNGLYFNYNMEKYKGKIATIKEINGTGRYLINLDKKFWNWSDDMFESATRTKKQLNDKISELEQQIAELKEQLEKKDNKMPDGKIWKPKEKEKYYYIDYAYPAHTLNDVDMYTNDFEGVDNRLIESGNCYPTKEKAEFEARREKYTRLFRQYVEQHSEPLDWNNEKQPKYVVYYDYEDKEIGYWHNTLIQQVGSIYASGIQILQEAIDFVGEENVKKYILDIGE